MHHRGQKTKWLTKTGLRGRSREFMSFRMQHVLWLKNAHDDY